MGLKADLQQLNSDLNDVGDKLDADLKRLEDKIANTPAAEDVSEEIGELRSTVSRLQGLDRPDPEQVEEPPAGPGTIVDPGVLNPPTDETTSESPGEPGGSNPVVPEDNSEPEPEPTPEPENISPGEVQPQPEENNEENV